MAGEYSMSTDEVLVE